MLNNVSYLWAHYACCFWIRQSWSVKIYIYVYLIMTWLHNLTMFIVHLLSVMCVLLYSVQCFSEQVFRECFWHINQKITSMTSSPWLDTFFLINPVVDCKRSHLKLSKAHWLRIFLGIRCCFFLNYTFCLVFLYFFFQKSLPAVRHLIADPESFVQQASTSTSKPINDHSNTDIGQSLNTSQQVKRCCPVAFR